MKMFYIKEKYRTIALISANVFDENKGYFPPQKLKSTVMGTGKNHEKLKFKEDYYEGIWKELYH